MADYKKEDDKDDGVIPEQYAPSQEVLESTEKDYGYIDDMVQLQQQTWPEFNDRTLKQFQDDGNRRLNAYTPPRDAFDPPKEEWQSNVSLPTIKDRQMTILSGFALSAPQMEVRAFGDDQLPDIDRGDVAKNLTMGSYLEQSNISLESFWEGWASFSEGTAVVYEGYLKTSYMQKFIKSYDLETGKIECDEREVTVDDKPISYLMPLGEFLISDFYIPDVQDQPRLAWIRYPSPEKVKAEFAKNPMFKYVKARSEFTNNDPDNIYFKSKWEDRCGKREYEVVRLYCKYPESYRVYINGVRMLDAPLLWRVNGVKVYPFAKTICMPFVNKQFFYGQSFPDHMKGTYDHYNTLWNTMGDNQFRRMVKPILVGRVNADALNLEDELITGGSTKITVEDVSQVKELTTGGLEAADVQMLTLVAKEMDASTPTITNFLQNRKQATAREVVLAQDQLRELKSIYAEMIVHLWQQKYALRLANIQQNYPQPFYTYENGKKKKVYRTYTMENVILDRATGDVGVLSVTFQNIPKGKRSKVSQDISVIEEQMRQSGLKFKKLYLPTDYLDNIYTRIIMIPAAVYKETLGYKQSLILDKMKTFATLFPQYFLAAQKELFGQVAQAYGDNPAKYEQAVDAMREAAAAAQQAQAATPSPSKHPATPPGKAAQGAPPPAPSA